MRPFIASREFAAGVLTVLLIAVLLIALAALLS
jgi:hypothetical protein